DRPKRFRQLFGSGSTQEPVLNGLLCSTGAPPILFSRQSTQCPTQAHLQGTAAAFFGGWLRSLHERFGGFPEMHFRVYGGGRRMLRMDHVLDGTAQRLLHAIFGCSGIDLQFFSEQLVVEQLAELAYIFKRRAANGAAGVLDKPVSQLERFLVEFFGWFRDRAIGQHGILANELREIVQYRL